MREFQHRQRLSAARAARVGRAVAMLFAAVTMAGQAVPVAAQQTRADQAAIRSVTKQVRPLRAVVASVRAQSPYDEMDYLGGPEFDAARYVYRLKFMDGSKVVFVYVDAVSGRIIGRSR